MRASTEYGRTSVSGKVPRYGTPGSPSRPIRCVRNATNRD